MPITLCYARLVSKSRSRRQVAALPMMIDSLGGLRVMLVTSRETRRWIIPKGWPMKGIKDWDAAAIEARQEAGLVGKIGKKPLGAYPYFKRLADSFELVRVTVYPLLVKRHLDDWPERHQRESVWLAPEIAARLVDEPELAEIIRTAAPDDRESSRRPERRDTDAQA